MRKLLLWLVMVAVMVAVILGGAAAFLYSRTGEDALPQQPVTFGEAALEPNGWEWVVPVLGDKVSKTYQSPTNLTVQKLGTFSESVPQLALPEWVTSAEVEITAPDGTTWTAGTEDCNTYTYTQNGDYEIVVTAYQQLADQLAQTLGRLQQDRATNVSNYLQELYDREYDRAQADRAARNADFLTAVELASGTRTQGGSQRTEQTSGWSNSASSTATVKSAPSSSGGSKTSSKTAAKDDEPFDKAWKSTQKYR